MRECYPISPPPLPLFFFFLFLFSFFFLQIQHKHGGGAQEKGTVDRVKSRRVRNRWTRQASVIPSEFKRAKSQIHALLFGFEVLQY
jgi:hypothetical protein